MQVHINHQLFHLPDDSGASIIQLLDQAGITSHTGIALAVNNQVIPRPHWGSHQLMPGDAITLISATQGG
ncbi:sulfur carrier protein ThiS [Filimonas lacunae]|uniref:Sulfur carrier protein ThiS n=1 Tax=Filimonas lacunae TaxID=477680 RepID=A0A173MP80_9BACT|nr:sulfur carrier protein ThiS [Filimonas lacunae]BAV09178.1 hypothetical protein FLA_5226 [Filimonas lacunae]SIS68481.1 sulfur carrier protein ThiS [Filimonas lacunae]